MTFCVLVLLLSQSEVVLTGRATDAITHLPIEGAAVTFAGAGAGGAFSGERDFEMRPGAHISGHIVDRDSARPLPGFSVLAKAQTNRSVFYWSKPSAEDGSFEILNDLSPGDYVLEIDPPSKGRISAGKPRPDEPGYARTWYPDLPREDMATPVALAPGENRDIELRLQKREQHHVAGMIQLPEGREKETISVSVTSGRVGSRIADGIDFKAGPYRMEGLGEGTYSVFATTGTGASLNREIEVGERSIDDLTLTLHNDITIQASVTVLEDKVDLPKGLVFFPFPTVFSDFVVGPSDTLRVEGLPVGRYWPALITPPGFAVTAASHGGRPVNSPPEFEAAESTVNFVITSRPASLSGMVRDSNQKPVPNIIVTLKTDAAADPVTQRKLTATSDAQGAYLLTDLAPGRYTASVADSSETIELDFGQTKILDLRVK